MTSIGALGSSADLAQLFARLSQQTDAASKAYGAGGANDSRRADFEARLKQAALAAGLDPAAVDGLQDEIKAAITDATAKSDGTTDRRQVIQKAIDGVLQKHGVDLKKFHSLMRARAGRAGGAPPQDGTAGGTREADLEAKFSQAAVAAGLDPNSADALQDDIKATIDQTLQQSDGQTDPRQAIQDAIDGVLKKYGVDPDMFKSELRSLVGTPQSAVPLVDEQA